MRHCWIGANYIYFFAGRICNSTLAFLTFMSFTRTFVSTKTENMWNDTSKYAFQYLPWGWPCSSFSFLLFYVFCFDQCQNVLSVKCADCNSFICTNDYSRWFNLPNSRPNRTFVFLRRVIVGFC